MTLLVIGLGSMGKRRIRLLRQIDETIEIIGVDSRSDRRKEIADLYGIITYGSLKNALLHEKCMSAFVCTAPLSHASLITRCLENGLNVFTEINLVSDGYERNINLAREKGLVLFLSSTFLYRDEIKYIQKQVEESKSLLTYSYHVGQYLSDWHPWENYTDYFVGDDRTNGCREIMAIELPWLIKTFGEIIEISVKKNKKTLLETSYNDSYLVLLQHETGIQGAFLVDVVSRKAVRNLEIFGEDLYLSWDGSPFGLKKYDINAKSEKLVALYDHVEQQEGYASFVVENAYKNEIQNFLEAIKSGNKVEYCFQDDMDVLGLIDEIEGRI